MVATSTLWVPSQPISTRASLGLPVKPRNHCYFVTKFVLDSFSYYIHISDELDTLAQFELGIFCVGNFDSCMEVQQPNTNCRGLVFIKLHCFLMGDPIARDARSGSLMSLANLCWKVLRFPNHARP